MAFVMVLSYSRHLFLRFYLNAAMNSFLRGHVEAFTELGRGCRGSCSMTILSSAVLERRSDAIRFHPTLLELAAHYRFQPRPVAVARGNEKGRVERAIRFVRDRFFAARAFKDIEDLNAQALAWCLRGGGTARLPGGSRSHGARVFEEERPHLLPLPDNPFPTEERRDVPSPQNPVPALRSERLLHPAYPCRPARSRSSPPLERVRVLDGCDAIATTRAASIAAQQIEEPAHIEALEAHKRAGRAHRALDRLHHAAPESQQLYMLAAERGVHLGALTRGLLQLLDTHGAAALAQAIEAALGRERRALARRAPLHRPAHAPSAVHRPPIPVTLAERSARARHRPCARLARLRTTEPRSPTDERTNPPTLSR